MKNVLPHIIFLLMLGPFPGHVSMGQDESYPNPLEVIAFCTDRSLYISGENIRFSATIITDNSPHENMFSNILYVEVIDQKNNQIIGEKFLVSNAVCTGHIQIPPDLPTEIYYIKSYTKYMRNFGPGSFSYHKIRVLNPFESTILVKDLDEDDQQTENFISSGKNENDVFHVETDRDVYRQSDSIEIKIIPEIHFDSLKSASIAVVPTHSSDPEDFITNDRGELSPGLMYLPEYHGITLTGILLDSISNVPLPSRQLELSILGDQSDFISVFTNSASRFFFTLPKLTGQITLFIGTAITDSVIPSILVDNDFSPLSIDLPYQSFHLSADEKITALNLARNVQIAEQYSSDSNKSSDEPEIQGDRSFYGIPTETLNIDDYIQLPTLEDYFNELPYLVKVRKLHGKKYLKIMGTSPGIQIHEPLVLMDMIAMYDIDAILSASSNQISHIDIVDEPYVKGNITYGGIISIFSKNNDFAGIDLPQSGIFIRYDFLSGSMPAVHGPEDSHAPDVRNTLYWNGNLQITTEAPEAISFAAGHSQGKYDIVLQGVMQNGKRFSQIVTFRVE